MSYTSGPHRFEVLKSNVGEMKAELSHIRGQTEQMMGMMQQLIQAKSADGGQHEEKSGGSGTGDAIDDSGDAGRAPNENGTAGTRVGATTETAAGGRVSIHSSRASDGARSPDDTGPRPVVLAGVGPMITMQSGEARYSFFAGIAAHDGDGVLSSGFQRQSRVVPHVPKGEKGAFQTFKHKFIFKQNMLDISGHFVGQGTRVVPVGDPLKQKVVILREGFSSEEIGRA